MNEWIAVNKNYGYYPTLSLSSSVSQVSAHLYTHTSTRAHAHSHMNHRLCNTHTLKHTVLLIFNLYVSYNTSIISNPSV